MIQKDIDGEKEKNNKLKRKLGSTESKYILIKQDYESKMEKQWGKKSNNTKIYLKQNNNQQRDNLFTKNELNAILNAVGGNRNIYLNILKKLNINENNIENNNNMKNLENQIETLLKKQKMNISKSNQLIEEINNIERNNNSKNEEIKSLKKVLEELNKEYKNKMNNNYEENKENKSDVFDDKIKSKISDKKINSNFVRIKIDANKKKEDNS
jgi:uncharacterized protein YoxC